MRTATPTRSKALLFGASVLALATSWQGPARADTVVTGNSGPVTITSGGLSNSGTVSSPYTVAVQGSGHLSTIANTGFIGNIGTYSTGTGIALMGGAATPVSLDLLNNSAGATIQGGFTAMLLINATISTLSNSGLLTATYPYYGDGINGVTTNIGNSVVSTSIGQLINHAGGTISGYAGINLGGGTVGTLINAGVISATNLFSNAINIGSGSASVLVSNGTYSTFQSVLTRGSIETFVNQATGTILGNVILSGNITTIENAGRIDGNNTIFGNNALTARTATIGGLTNLATGTISGFTDGLALSGSTIGSLTNSGTITAASSYTSNYAAAAVDLRATTIYGTQATANSAVVGTLLNDIGARISATGWGTGIALTGSTIGTLINRGVISSASTAIEAGSAIIGTYVYTGQTYVYQSIRSDAQIGTLLNGVTGTIIGTLNNAISLGGTIGVLDNAGIIQGSDTAAGISVLGTTATIGALTNEATGTISAHVGISVGLGTIGTLRNDGLIQAAGNYYSSAGISISQGYGYGSISGEIGTLINGASGTIRGGTSGIVIASSAIGTLINSGDISGKHAAIQGSGYWYNTVVSKIDSLINTGTLTATGIGTLANYGTAIDLNNLGVGTLTNSGLISGAYAMSLYNDVAVSTIPAGTIGLLNNLAGGQIIGTGTIEAINVEADIGTLANAGLISAKNGIRAIAISVSDNGSIATLGNAATGTITASGSGIAVYSSIGAINNDGTIQGGTSGIRNRAYARQSNFSYGSGYTFATSSSSAKGSVGTLSNTGQISGSATGVASAGTIGSLSNAGTVTGVIGIKNLGAMTRSTYTTTYFSQNYSYSASTTAITTTVGGSVGVLNNTGTVVGSQSGIVNGQVGQDTITQLTRDYYTASILSQSTVTSPNTLMGGTIGTLMNSGTILGTTVAGIDNGAANAVIGTLVNSGLIQGGQTGIINAGTIGTLTNSGTITGAMAAIRDSGTLGPVTNTGVIAGDIVHTAASDLSITGGSGTVFGTLTGVNGAHGTLASTAGNVTLAGNLVLNDSVSITGHALTNAGGNVMLTAPTTITGDYAQAGGTLTAMAGGGTVGGLQVGGNASISGATVVLTSQYAYGLTSGASYTIVAAGDAASSYASVTALAPGYDSTTVTSTVVGGQTDLVVSVGNSGLSAGGSVTIAGGAGVLDRMTGGTLAITGGTPTVESITGGTLTQTSGSASLGTVTGGTITLAGGGATLGTISGGTLTQGPGSTIAGTTAVQVQGGSLNLGGTVQAPLAVTGGLVALNGSASGPVTVGSGGTLRGSGVITGAATVAGVLRPGNSPGTLIFTDGLTQAAKSVLSIDIDGTGTGKGAGNYSRVLVTGGSYVIGSGAVLQPNLRGMTGSASNTYTPNLGTDFTIVQAAAGVSGTFAGITQPSSGLLAGTQFTALYGSNAVDLYVTPTYGNLASLGASANQQTMGRVVAGLSSTGNADLTAVLKALYGLPTVGASLDALAQIGGSSQANIVAYSLNRGLAATQVLGQRLAAVRDGVAGGMQGTMQAQLVGRTLYTSMASGGDGPVIEDERGVAAGSAPEEGWHFWAQGLGAFTRVDSDGNAEGGHSNTGGGLFGGDRTVAPGVTLGLAGVLLQSTSGGSNETSSYGLSAYGNVDLGDGLFVTGNAGYTYDQYDTARTMGFGGLSRTAFGHTTGDELSAGVTAGYRVRVSNLTLEPQAGIQWLKVGRDGFTETGAGALNLVLQDLDATALQSSVGGRASASWKTDGGTVITPALRAAWLHDFRDRALTSQAALAGTTFAVTGPDTGANALGIGGGLTLQEGNNLNLYANYDGTLRRHETDHVFTAGFRLSW